MTNKKDNGFCFKDFGNWMLVEALSNCSSDTQKEVGDELAKIRDQHL